MRRALPALLLVFFLQWSSVAVASTAAEGACSGAEEEICSSSSSTTRTGTDEAPDESSTTGTDEAPDDEIDCPSQVRLFDGFPSSSGGGGRSISLQNADDPQTVASFSKVSRYDDDKKLREMRDELFHIAPNGDHMGWVVYVPSDQCLHEAMRLVAQQIVTSPSYKSRRRNTDLAAHVDARGPHRLVDQEGRAYPQQSDSAHHLHLLLPRESFVHEAVEEGWRRTLRDGTVIETVSIIPRVFVVDPILTSEECKELIDVSSSRFHRSGETHYSPGFENYRTSLDGETPRRNKVAQKLWRKVMDLTAMETNAVEFPQLIKYETDVSWYKKHMDYFHSYDNKPLEELRVFVETRAKELVRLNVGEVSQYLNSTSYRHFDGVEHLMKQHIASRLVDALNLPRTDSISDDRLLIHFYLKRSDNPVREFSLAAIHLGAHLLEVTGAGGDSLALAEKYFAFDEIPHLVEDYVPYFVKPIEVNRHVTVLPILGAAEEGGHTAFPHSSSQMGIAPARGESIDECKSGLILKPNTGKAVMFYNRLPTGELDPLSEHAGCSVQAGVKYAANCFTWEVEQRWAWRFQTEAEELYAE